MIVIATDSTACLTKQEARQLGVIYVPMTYTVAGNTYTEHFVEDNGNYESLSRHPGASYLSARYRLL